MRLADVDPRILATNSLVLATNGPDGRPHLTAMWFRVEDEHVLMSSTRGRQKVRNLQRDPRCSLLLFHTDSPYCYAQIRGEAVVSDDLEYARADLIGARYDADFRSFDGPAAHRVILDVTPAKVLVVDSR